MEMKKKGKEGKDKVSVWIKRKAKGGKDKVSVWMCG